MGEQLTRAHAATRRARTCDPATSHAAAAGAEFFASGHKRVILSALRQVADATAHELARLTGLTVVQLDRRLPEMEAAGAAEVVTFMGMPAVRGGARVWRAKA